MAAPDLPSRLHKVGYVVLETAHWLLVPAHRFTDVTTSSDSACCTELNLPVRQVFTAAHGDGGPDEAPCESDGGIAFYYQRRDTLRGTYVSEAPVMYGALSQILTWMDRRIANGIETVAEAIAWTEIQGADVWDPITFALDDDIRDAIQTKIAKAIRDRYASEFQNASDPNLVVIDPTVSVDGSRVVNGRDCTTKRSSPTNAHSMSCGLP